MIASKRSTPSLTDKVATGIVASLLAGTMAPAMAGTQQSALDPYAYVQPKKSSKQHADAAPKAIPNVEDEPSTTTFMTMPTEASAASHKKGGVPGSGLLSKAGGLFGGSKKDDKGAREEKVATESKSKESLKQSRQIAAKPEKSEKADKGGIVDSVAQSTKKVTDGIASGSKGLGGGVVNGTKKMGEGIASGAGACGSVFMKGAHAIGEGLKSTGGMMADGSKAAASKVAVFPKAIGHGVKSTGDKVKDSTGSLTGKLASKKTKTGKTPPLKVIPSPMTESATQTAARPVPSQPGVTTTAKAIPAHYKTGESKSLMSKLPKPKLPSLKFFGSKKKGETLVGSPENEGLTASKGKSKGETLVGSPENDGRLTASTKSEPLE